MPPEELTETVLTPAPEGELGEAPAEDSPAETDDDIVEEAKNRFQKSQTFESVARQRWIEDLKFAEADADNHYQWPNEIRRERDIDERPCLTINKTRQHNLQIINEAKQNKPSIKIRATGGGATVDSAKVYNSIMRHIEYVSKAQIAYDTATGFQVKAGKGYLRIITEYEDDDSFNQIPLIKRIGDPLTVYLDCDAKEADKSDGKYGFVFEDMDEKEFKRKYPEYSESATGQTMDESFGWRKEDSVRMAEYYRVVEHDDVLYAVPRPDAQPGAQAEPVMFRESELSDAPDILAKMKAMPGVKSRETKRSVVEWFLIVGSTIVDRADWVGKFVPIIQVVGEETCIEGQYDCKGHTRALIDPQRMYNYMSSISVEYSGLQSKSPYIAAAEAIEGLETYWENANKVNYSVLPYNARSDDGTPIEAPRRQEPPVPMPAALSGMQIASQEMMMASGQYEAEFGQKGNERSAKAINERERASSTSTYHFVDNLGIAIRFVGLQLMDLIPKLYDTPRIMNIMAEDGTSYEVMIDPSAAEAMKVRQQADINAANQVLFNPNVGKYDVQADVGPNWGTKRQETFNALSLILTQAPQLTGLIGDLLLQTSDFELAEEAAVRLRRMVPKEALGQGPSQQEQLMKAQIDQLTEMLKETFAELAKEKIKLKGKDALRQVDVFRAYTERLKAVADAAEKAGRAISPQELAALADQVVDESLDLSLDEVLGATGPGLRSAADMGNRLPAPAQGVQQGAQQQQQPQVPGARRAPDGNYYVQNAQGQYARVQ